MIDDETLTTAMNVMLTCSPLECSKESACALVAKHLRDLLAVHEPHVIAPEADDVIADYGTGWECPGC